MISPVLFTFVFAKAIGARTGGQMPGAPCCQPHAVYYDVTWTGFCDEIIPSEIQNVFEVVRDARRSAVRFVIEKTSRKESFAGFEVDDVARGCIQAHG